VKETKYNPDAGTDDFDRFVESVLDFDQTNIGFMQRFFEVGQGFGLNSGECSDDRLF
jgi:hypothetical protein